MTSENSDTDRIEDDERGRHSVSRRIVLGLIGLGSLGVPTGSASGQASGPGSGQSGGAVYDWKQDVNANGNALTELGSLAMADNPTAITDLVGANISVDNGVLNTNLWDADVDAAENSLLNVDLVETASLSVSNVGASVYSSSSGEYGGGGSTIEYDTVQFDHRDEFDITDHQFTASRNGYYQVSAGAAVESPGDGETVRITLRVNDAAEVRTELHASSDSTMDPSTSKLLELVEGDQVEAILSNPSSGEPGTYLAGKANTWLTIHQVG